MSRVLQAFLDETRAGRRCVLATIVRSTGSTPRTAGARLLVRADGTSLGTIGGGAFEAQVVADALSLLGADAPSPRTRRYTLTESGADAVGMACGGTAEVLLEPASGGTRLVVFGAGHVGLALARLAGTVGFACEIVDDRPEFCDAAAEARLGRVVRADANFAGGTPEIDRSCFVAVVTRCHRTDRAALRLALPARPRYVGLIGSRRKKTVIFRELAEEDGVPAEALSLVHCPIGLPIGGETPEEIAVSIVAELLQIRNAPS